MADDLIDFADEAEETTSAQADLSEISNFPQTLVTEKIIFCIDILLLSREHNNDMLVRHIAHLVKSYFNLKKKICVKPPEFEYLLIHNNDKISHSHITNLKDIESAFLLISNIPCEEEDQPLKIDKVFNKIAELVELPDPSCHQNLPPESVYHVVWLFGRNFYIPTMENTNSFDFLMMTPYFALDILYVFDASIKLNQCEQISQALSGLNENGMGYFLTAGVKSEKKLFSAFAQMLGHPLIRLPQVKAKFCITQLGPEMETPEKCTEEEKIDIVKTTNS